MNSSNVIDGVPARNTLKYWFARIFSNIFHPFFIPTICMLVLYTCFPYRFAEYEYKTKVVSIGVIFAITVIYPTLAIVIMNKLGMINSINLRDRKDRIIPYVVVLTFYIWICYMALKPSNNNMLFPNDFIFSHMMLSMTLSIAIAFIANNFLKVSMHMLGHGGFVGFLLFTTKFSPLNYEWIFVLAILVAGCVGTARLILKAHTIQEIIAGFSIAILGAFIVFTILPAWGIFS